MRQNRISGNPYEAHSKTNKKYYLITRKDLNFKNLFNSRHVTFQNMTIDCLANS